MKTEQTFEQCVMPPIVVSFVCAYFARRCEANFINGGNKLKAMALVASRGRLEHIRGGKYSQETLWQDVKKIHLHSLGDMPPYM